MTFSSKNKYGYYFQLAISLIAIPLTQLFLLLFSLSSFGEKWSYKTDLVLIRNSYSCPTSCVVLAFSLLILLTWDEGNTGVCVCVMFCGKDIWWKGCYHRYRKPESDKDTANLEGQGTASGQRGDRCGTQQHGGL